MGRTSVISCEPAELHFRGIKQGEPVQQIVQLRNDSARQTRVMVVPPTSSYFKARLWLAVYSLGLTTGRDSSVASSSASSTKHHRCLHSLSRSQIA